MIPLLKDSPFQASAVKPPRGKAEKGKDIWYLSSAEEFICSYPPQHGKLLELTHFFNAPK